MKNPIETLRAAQAGGFISAVWQRDCKVRKGVTARIEKRVAAHSLTFGVNYDNRQVVKDGREDGSLPAENAGLRGFSCRAFSAPTRAARITLASTSRRRAASLRSISWTASASRWRTWRKCCWRVKRRRVNGPRSWTLRLTICARFGHNRRGWNALQVSRSQEQSWLLFLYFITLTIKFMGWLGVLFSVVRLV